MARMACDDHYVPVMLNCRGRLCLIVGGGKVAERKAVTLLNARAVVHIVSPLLRSEKLQRLESEKTLRWTKRKYQSDDLIGAFMVHAATDDSKLNLQIAEDANRLGVLVNVASNGEAGTFINPTVLRREGLRWLYPHQEQGRWPHARYATSSKTSSGLSMRTIWIFI